MSNLTMRKPLRKSFTLEKVKTIKGGGLEINYEVEDVIGQEAYHDKDTKKSTKVPHPDLTGQLALLVPMLARVYHFTFIREVIIKPEFKASEDQSRFAERALQAIMEKISVTGVSISGQDANKGIIITGTFSGDVLNVKMAINSHRIKFNSTTYGFEEGLEDLIEKLTDEVYEYLFEGKQAQLEMFGNNEQAGLSGKDAAAGEGKDDGGIDDVFPEDNTGIQDPDSQEPEEKPKKGKGKK